jgi:signal transduction histidine kinase
LYAADVTDAPPLDSPLPHADAVTRRLLLRVCGVLMAGVTFGLALGIAGYPLTPVEWWLLPALLVLIGCIAFGARIGDERVFLLSARVLGVAGCIYLLIGAGHHLVLLAEAPGSLVYLVWLPGYHVLIYAVVDAGWARRLSILAFLAGGSVLAAALVVHPQLGLDDPALVAAVVLMLVQLAVMGLLQVMMRYRTRFAAAEARTEVLQQVEGELRGALEEARQARAEAEARHRQARDARARLETVFRELDVGLALFGADGVLVLHNAPIAALLAELDLDPAQSLSAAAIGRAVRRSPGGEGARGWLARLAEVADGRQSQVQIWAPDGRSYLATGAPLAGGEALFSLVDTSELERNRRALARLQRMESLGRLVGGVAHDFNNLFGALMASLELLDDPHMDGQRRHEMVARGMEGIERGAALTARLLRFAGRGGGHKETVSLHEAVEQLRQVTDEHAAGIELSIGLPDDLPAVYVDEAGLHGALAGLVRNACEAQPDGGTVSVEAVVVALAGAAAEALELPPGDYVEVTCRDAGAGIDPAVMDRVLEPFFSTKRDRHGVGLGLSSAYGFARESGGDLRLDSSPGAGTTVRLLLPAARGS